MWDGYLSMGGIGIGNRARAYGYAMTSDCPAMWLDDPECDGLAEALGDQPYTFENITAAPWYDPDNDDLSRRFLGAYIVSIDGLRDSTRTATMTQRALNGGRIGARRFATRDVRVRAWLTSAGRDAMDYGMSWLAASVQAGACGQHNSRCGVSDLAFFTECPPPLGLVPDHTPWALAETNLMTNPSFEATSGTVEVRRNLQSNPQAAIGWSTGYGTGGAGTNDLVDDARFPGGKARRVTWTAAPSSSAGLFNGGVNVGGLTPGTAYLIRYVYAVTGWDGIRAAIYAPNGVAQTPTTNTPLGDGLVEAWLIWTPNAGVTTFAGSLTVSTVDGTLPSVGSILLCGGSLVEASSVYRPYFDGSTSPDSDLTPSWTGTANASPSVLTGDQVPGAFIGSSTYAYQSGQWSASGAHSLRVTPRRENNDTFAPIGGDTGGFRLGMTPGKTYTAIATARLATPQTGQINPTARKIRAFYKSASGSYLSMDSPAAPNLAGEYELRVTFTIPSDATEAFVRLYNGATQGNGDVWWDDFTIVEGEYTGNYFDGSTMPDGADPDLVRVAWTGTANASTSTLETREDIMRPQTPTEYQATLSPLRRFVHDVDVTSAPFTVEERESSDDVHIGRLVEFTLSAEDPFIYGVARPVELLPSIPIVVQDTPYNLVQSPSMELAGSSLTVATNYSTNPSAETDVTGWLSGSNAAVSAAGTVAAPVRSTELAAVGVASAMVEFTATAASSGSVGALSVQQKITLPGPAGRAYSFNLWASAMVSAGTAVLDHIDYYVTWVDASSNTTTVDLGDLPVSGGAVSASSLVPPAGSVSAYVTAQVVITSWSAGAKVRIFGDAFALTVP